MKIRAKVGGELTMHGQGIHWVHKAGEAQDFSEDVGKRILTNSNYEKASVTSGDAVPEKKTEPEKKKEGGKP